VQCRAKIVIFTGYLSFLYYFIPCNVGRYYNRQLLAARIRHIFIPFLLFI